MGVLFFYFLVFVSPSLTHSQPKASKMTSTALFSVQYITINTATPPEKLPPRCSLRPSTNHKSSSFFSIPKISTLIIIHSLHLTTHSLCSVWFMCLMLSCKSEDIFVKCVCEQKHRETRQCYFPHLVIFLVKRQFSLLQMTRNEAQDGMKWAHFKIKNATVLNESSLIIFSI